RQRLPLPIGSPHPLRGSQPPVRLSSHGRPAAAAMLGLAAAVTGAVLATMTPTVDVALDAGSYRVGNVTLPARGGGVYASASGAVVIAEDGDGLRASGSTRLHGVRMVGFCRLTTDQRSERCSFELGGRSGTAIDQPDGGGGGGGPRRYQDGQRLRIQLDGGRPVPVPIALGR